MHRFRYGSLYNNAHNGLNSQSCIHNPRTQLHERFLAHVTSAHNMAYPLSKMRALSRTQNHQTRNALREAAETGEGGGTGPPAPTAIRGAFLPPCAAPRHTAHTNGGARRRPPATWYARRNTAASSRKPTKANRGESARAPCRVAFGGYFSTKLATKIFCWRRGYLLATFKFTVVFIRNGFVYSSVVKTLFVIPLLFYFGTNFAIILNGMATSATFGVSSGAFSIPPSGNPGAVALFSLFFLRVHVLSAIVSHGYARCRESAQFFRSAKS